MTTKLKGAFVSALLLPCSLLALPQQVGNIFNNPVAGLDMTTPLLDTGIWVAGAKLPGDWLEEPGIAGETIFRIEKQPFLFGHVPQMVTAVQRDNKLHSITITYLEAGLYFGYQPELKKSDSGKKKLREQERQFRKLYKDLSKSLEDQVKEVTGSRPRSKRQGLTNALRTTFDEYQTKDLSVQLHRKEGSYVRVKLQPRDEVGRTYLQPGIADLKRRERQKVLSKNVEKRADGDVTITGIPLDLQGERAYCGINSFIMITRYYGCDLDAEIVASSAGFSQGLGGRNMIEAYNAAGKEANIRINRSGSFDFDRAMKLIDSGNPILVWRKFDHGRDRLHTKVARRFARDKEAALPTPDGEDQKTWPSGGHPNHASVITGYNKDRRELIFSESWSENSRNRRMRTEELEGTCYFVFYFRP